MYDMRAEGNDVSAETESAAGEDARGSRRFTGYENPRAVGQEA